MFDFLTGALYEGADINDDSAEYDAYMESIEAIPCEDDLDDAFARIAMENVENFYAIANAITVDEFAYYVQTNEQVVYEEGRISSVCDKIKTWLEKAWAKIKGVFEKALGWLDQAVRNDKKFIEKYESKIKNKKDVKMSGYDIKLDSTKTNMMQLLTAKFQNQTGLMLGAINSKDLMESYKDVDAAKMAATIRGYVVGKNEELSVEAFNKAIKETFIPDKKDITISASTAIEEVRGAKEARAHVKSEYTKTKNYFKSCMKNADRLKKEAIQATSRKEAKEAGVMKIVGQWNSLCKSCISIAHTVEKYQLKAVSIIRSQYKSAIVKMANGDDKSKDDVKNESASFLDSIELI